MGPVDHETHESHRGAAADRDALSAAGRIRLKHNVKRTVEVERGPGPPTLLKRFHAPGLGALRDRARARSEARAMRRAANLGLPVPGVLGIEREDGRWVLRTEFIEGARSLDAVLRNPRVGPRRRVALAHRLGILLATVQATGMRHPDPHPENVLVDATGKLWLIDLARVRFGASPRSVLRTLVTATARLLEACPPALRASVHRAWRRAGGTGFTDVAETERTARSIRIEEIAARVPVWCRESSATVVARDEDGRRRAWVRERRGLAPEPGFETRRIEGSADACRAAWGTLVRASLHGIPCALARSLTLEPPHTVEYDVPTGATATERCDARTEALLASRGLRLDPARLLVDARGRTVIDALARLRPCNDRKVT